MVGKRLALVFALGPSLRSRALSSGQRSVGLAAEEAQGLLLPPPERGSKPPTSSSCCSSSRL